MLSSYPNSKNHYVYTDLLLNTYLTHLSSATCVQPEINDLVRKLYATFLSVVIDQEFEMELVDIETRMHQFDSRGILRAQPIVNPKQKVVVINVARAGFLGGQVCFDILNTVIDPPKY